MTLSIRTKIVGLMAALLLSLALVGPAMAAQDEDVVVTANNAAALTLEFSDLTVDFGTVTFNGVGATPDNFATTENASGLPTSTAYISDEKVTLNLISNAPTNLSIGAGSTGAIPLGNFSTFTASSEPPASSFASGTPLAPGPVNNNLGTPNTGFTLETFIGVQVFATTPVDGAGGTTVTITVIASNIS